MKTFRVVLKIPAKLYAYHDIEAVSREALEDRLSTQAGINDLVSWHSCEENAEPDESAEWTVEEIGPSATLD